MNNWFDRGKARQEFNALIGTIKTPIISRNPE